MTNALAQNIDSQNTSTADILMQAVSVSSNAKTQEESSSKFSNFMNNLDARTQKAQNNFQEKAKVTNTSSINKKALEKKEVVDNSKIINKKITKEPQKEFEKPVEPKEPKKVETASSKETSTNTSAAAQNTESKEVADKNTISHSELKQTDNSENLSDINNSSPVESSPALSLQESKAQVQEDIQVELDEAIKEIETKVEELLNTIPVVNENIKTDIKDIKAEIENIIESSENIEQIVQKVEEIFASLDNSNLSQEHKEELVKFVDELTKTLENLNEKSIQETDFQNILSQLIEKTENLVKDLTVEVDKNELTKNIEKTDLNSEVVVNKGDKTISDLTKTTEETKVAQNLKATEEIKVSSATAKETLEAIETLVKDIQNAIELNDVDKLNKLSDELSKITQEINSTDNKEVLQNVEIDKELADSILKLQKLLEKNSQLSKQENIVVEIPEENLEQTVSTQETKILDNLTSKDFEKIDIADKKSMNELLNLLESTKESLDLNELNQQDLKVELEKLIKQINENQISSEDLSQAIETISDEIKLINETQVSSEESSINLIDLTSEFEKFENNQNQQNNTKNQNSDNQNQLKNNKIELTQDDFNFEGDYDFQEVELKGKVSQKIDIQNVEENLQKTVAIQEMLDEMMVEVDIKTIPSASGALSVADEIAKLAIGESNSLNPVTSVHGSVTYDATGTNAVIKNVASLMKSAQTQTAQNAPSMEDVLNQVSNKITQLKDGATQKLTMVLRPNDLGRLSIELISNQNGLTTQIMAQNENVRAYIEKNIDSLRQQLSDAGVNVNNIQIKTAGSEGSTTNYEGNQNFNREQQQDNLNQQNNKNQQQNQNKNVKEVLASISNYDMHFAKDFSSVLNKSLSYNIN